MAILGSRGGVDGLRDRDARVELQYRPEGRRAWDLRPEGGLLRVP